MSFKHMMILIGLVLVAMFVITEKNLDYNKFIDYVRQTQPHSKKVVNNEISQVSKTFDGVFAAGNCVKLDDTDYFKIVAEDATNYTHVLCKFEGKCLTTPVKEARTDFEISYSESDIILCPVEQ